jgi:hypothetical protein
MWFSVIESKCHATCHKLDSVATASQISHNNPENKEFCRRRAKPVAYLVLTYRHGVAPRAIGRAYTNAERHCLIPHKILITVLQAAVLSGVL